MFIGPIVILFLPLLNVIVFYLNGEGCCVLGPRLPLGRALERLTIGLGTTTCVGEIKPSSKVESVVIFNSSLYNPSINFRVFFLAFILGQLVANRRANIRQYTPSASNFVLLIFGGNKA